MKSEVSCAKHRENRTEVDDETMTEWLRIREQVEQIVISSLTIPVPKTVLGNLVFSEMSRY